MQVIVDGDNANTATTVMGYAQAIVAEAVGDAAMAAGAHGAAGAAPLADRFEPRVWYNPQLRSTLFLVPGLIAYIAMITAVISTALSVVREKERGDDGADADGAGEPGGVRASARPLPYLGARRSCRRC